MRAIAFRLGLCLLALTAACNQSAAPATAPTPSPASTAAPPSPAGVPTTAAPEPTESATPAPTRTPEPTGASQVTAFYVRAGGGNLWVEPEVRRLDEPTVGVAAAAMRELFTGTPREPGLERPIEPDVEVLGADLEDGVLTVNLAGTVLDTSGGSAQEIALQQALAHTGTQFDSVEAVQLWVDGGPVTDLWGHLDWSQPFEPDPFAVVPIDIIRPPGGAEQAAGPVTAAGEANTFEATVELRLIDPSGAVVEETFTTATCGSGCRGTWEHTFEVEAAQPGAWTIQASEPDPSGGEGRPPFRTTRRFTVTG